MANGNNGFANPFQLDYFDLLERETQPRGAYFSALPETQTPNQAQWFQNYFDDFMNSFYGVLGQQIRSGGAPTARVTPFATSFAQSKPFASLPPFMRPGLPARVFAPPARFLTY